jgi:tyrosyl-tRNA synthetase
MIKSLRREIPSVQHVGKNIVNALVVSTLATSKTDARRLLSSGAVYVNNKQVNRDEFNDQDFTNGRLILRRGKAYKDSALIEEK